jgi:hypothetical protein
MRIFILRKMQVAAIAGLIPQSINNQILHINFSIFVFLQLNIYCIGACGSEPSMTLYLLIFLYRKFIFSQYEPY